MYYDVMWTNLVQTNRTHIGNIIQADMNDRGLLTTENPMQHTYAVWWCNQSQDLTIHGHQSYIWQNLQFRSRAWHFRLSSAFTVRLWGLDTWNFHKRLGLGLCWLSNPNPDEVQAPYPRLALTLTVTLMISPGSTPSTQTAGLPDIPLWESVVRVLDSFSWQPRAVFVSFPLQHNPAYELKNGSCILSGGV